MPTNVVDLNHRVIVSTRVDWQAEWVEQPFLFCDSARREAWPGIGVASFRYEVGPIKEWNQLEITQKAPLQFLNQFVRVEFIRLDDPNPTPTRHRVFYGIITSAEDEILQDGANLIGFRRYAAQELSLLLDREIVRDALCRHMADTTPVDLHWVPTFNRVARSGEGIVGNRHADVQPSGILQDAYLFHDDFSASEEWEARQALDYLLALFAYKQADPNIVPTFYMAGVDLTNKEIWDVGGQSYWQALGTIANRKRGLGLALDVVGSDGNEEVELVAFSVSDIAISTGSYSFPASDRQGPFILPNPPYDQCVEPIRYRYSSSGRYSKIEVRGDRPKILCSFSFYSENLVKGWRSADETKYRDMSGTTTAEADQKRANDDELQQVFQEFSIKPDWDGKVDKIDDTTPTGNCFPTLATNATFNFSSAAKFVWLDRVFEPTVTLKVGFKYDALPPTDAREDTKRAPEYGRPVLFIQDDTSSPNHAATNKWHRLNQIHRIPGISWTPTIRVHDRYPAMMIDSQPPHRLALGIWDEEDDQSAVSADFDYRKMGFTVVMKHDEKIRYVVDLGTTDSPGGIPQTLVVDLPKLQLWLVAKGATYQIDASGNLVAVASAGTASGILKDDREKMKEVAAALQAWYGVVRQVITLKINRVADFGVNVGHLITSVLGPNGSVPVNGVISSIDYQFGPISSITFETGWGEADYIPDFTRAYE